jgi:hypothetical protein
MSRQESNGAARCIGIRQHGVQRCDRANFLIVAVCAGMKVGPRNTGRDRIVRSAACGIRIEVTAMEVMRLANTSQIADETRDTPIIGGCRDGGLQQHFDR